MKIFEYLFYCADNIPEGVGFPLFGLGHLIWLGSIALVTTLVCRKYRKAEDRERQKVRWWLWFWWCGFLCIFPGLYWIERKSLWKRILWKKPVDGT